MRGPLRPLLAMARRADSRPAPGPFTRTSRAFMPWSIALRQASSAATCAANGVDLREPLKPRAPHVDHATVPPVVSVMVTTVLLNDAKTCATPMATFFLTRFLPLGD